MTFKEKVLHRVNDMKIRKKLIYIYLVVVLVPVLLVGIYLTNGMRTLVMQRAIDEACTNTDRTQQSFEEVLKKATEIADRIYIDEDIQKIVSTNYLGKYDGLSRLVNDYYNFKTFDEYLHFYNELDNIRFYVNNQTMLDNSQFIKASETIKNTTWYKAAVESDGRINWRYEKDQVTNRQYLSLSRLVKNSNNNVLGVLVINLSSYYIANMIKDEPYGTVIVLGRDNIVAANNSISSLSTIIDNNILKKTVRNFQVNTKYNGNNFKVIVNTFGIEKSSAKFAVMNIVPVGSIVTKANKTSLLGFAIIALSLIISIFMIVTLTDLLTKRIIKLRAEMNKVVTGDFNISRDFEGNDEIGELYSDLNIMIDSIQQLILEVYEEKLQKEKLNNKQREVEFKMLASQINPHFLYNTLETIRMKAHANKQPEIASIVKKLAVLMRRNLEVSNKLVSLEWELELVKNYLEIQKFRFGERVSYEINIKCDIEQYKILPLLLQPVVENAIVHGLENKEGNGTIKINIEKREQFLTISIIDNGIGIDNEKLKLLNNKINCFTLSEKQSIGLSNVNQRIKLFYGDNYYVKLKSVVNLGTEILLYLPSREDGFYNVESTYN